MIHTIMLCLMGLCLTCIAYCNPDSGLVLEIKAAADRLVAGEPVVLHVALTNRSADVLSASHELAQWGSYARYFVSTDGAEFRELPGHLSERYVAPTPLAPGQSFHHLEWLLIDTSAARLDEPSQTFLTEASGQYMFYVQYKTPLGDGTFCRLVSNQVTITVLEPSPEAQAIFNQMRDVIKVFETNPDEYNASRMKATQIDGLLTLTSQVSPYAPYAALVLAHHELSKTEFRTPMAELQALRLKRSAKALEYLKNAEVPGFPLLSEVFYQKIRAYRLMSFDTSAAELEDRILAEFPDSAAAYKVRKEREQQTAPPPGSSPP